jgi:hypothetical protein
LARDYPLIRVRYAVEVLNEITKLVATLREPFICADAQIASGDLLRS